MKKNNLKETAKKNLKELKNLLKETKERLSKIKLEKSLGKAKNLKIAKNLKKDIAQIETIISSKIIMEAK